MKDFFHKNGALILVIALLVSAILWVGSAIWGLSPLTNLLGVLATPFRAAANAAAVWMEDRYNYAFRYEDLLEENEILRNQLAEAQAQLRDAQDANRQNAELRELLELAKRHADFEFEDASVTARAATNWDYTLTIDKGSSTGVKVGDFVVDRYGNLLGVVRKTGLNWAEFAAVVDPSTELGVRLPRSDSSAVLEGDFTLMLRGRVKLAYLPQDSLPLAGDQVTTSGLGDQYPAGLVVGTVESLHTEDSGLTPYAVVVPAADPASIRYVFVIKSFDVVE